MVSRKLVLIIILVVIVGGASAGVYEWHHHKNISSTAKQAQTTSTAKTAQSSYSGGASRTPTTNTSNNSGGAQDTKGANATSTGAATPTSSTSGLITLNQPGEHQTISSGLNLYGTASVPTVEFRVVDDQAGVIAQGELAVTGGKYSGTLQFKAVGTTGQVDVYSLDPTTGAEVNNIKVDVGFQK